MSPILVRPVREQLEHDRLVRFLLLNRYKRRFDAIGNLGDDHAVSIKVGTQAFFPDIVLVDGKKLVGVVEVETGESVNNLEALAEWVHFARTRVPFHLYVPVPSYDSARRLCDLHHVKPTEIWTYRAAIDGFDLMRAQQNPVAGSGKVATFERAEPKPVPVVVEKVEPKVEPTPVAAKPAKPVKSAPPEAARPSKAPIPPASPAGKTPTKPVKDAAPATAVAPVGPKPVQKPARKPGASQKVGKSTSAPAPEKAPNRAKPATRPQPTRPARSAKSARPGLVPKGKKNQNSKNKKKR